MTSKTFEIRDRGTFIAVLAVQLEAETVADHFLIARSGFGRTPEVQSEYILLYKLCNDGFATHDAYTWKDSTTQEAHRYINKNFNTLESGAVIDCEFLRGETEEPKKSEHSDRIELI